MTTDERVDGYVAKLPTELHAVAASLRAVLVGFGHKLTETSKWTQPGYELNGPVCGLKAVSDLGILARCRIDGAGCSARNWRFDETPRADHESRSRPPGLAPLLDGGIGRAAGLGENLLRPAFRLERNVWSEVVYGHVVAGR